MLWFFLKTNMHKKPTYNRAGPLFYVAVLLKFSFLVYAFGFYVPQIPFEPISVQADVLFMPEEDHATDDYPPLAIEPDIEIEVTPTYQAQEADMLAFGDLLLDRYVRTLIERNGPESILAGVEQYYDQPFFEGYDLVFANLEGPVTPYRIPTSKSIAFQFSPEHLSILTDHHFNLVSTANNHVVDMGKQGYQDTYRYLDEWGIESVGDAKGLSDKSTYETEIDGVKLGFVGLNHTDFKIDINEASRVIADLKTRNDFVVVSIHWGVEYQHVPQDFQREWARQMVEAGADVILGHHPHVLQGFELIEGKPVFYSLGNFVFDQWFSEETQETVAVHLQFKKEGDARRIHVGLTPIRMNMSLPYFPDEQMSQQILDRFYEYSYETNPAIEAFSSFFKDRWIRLDF